MHRVDDTLTEIKEDYTHIDTFQELYDRFDKMSDIEHISQIKNVFLPKVEKFSSNFDNFLKTVNDIKEVVARFDEDLCIKASKADL